jgi:uncharacterized protein YebE (UPF0316 family)
MSETIINFLTAASPLELFLIFISKIVEVAIYTLRIILIGKGYRKQGTLLSFAEIVLWVFVASRVIMGMAEAPIKGVIYSIGFTAGVYIGSALEARIAMGMVMIEAIISRVNSKAVTGNLRDKGYAVTTVEAMGRDSEKTVLKIFANRKGMNEIINEIQTMDGTAMIISNDITTLRGGTIGSVRKLAK